MVLRIKNRAGSGGRGESEIIPALQNASIIISKVAPEVYTFFEKKCSYPEKILSARKYSGALVAISARVKAQNSPHFTFRRGFTKILIHKISIIKEINKKKFRGPYTPTLLPHNKKTATETLSATGLSLSFRLAFSRLQPLFLFVPTIPKKVLQSNSPASKTFMISRWEYHLLPSPEK